MSQELVQVQAPYSESLQQAVQEGRIKHWTVQEFKKRRSNIYLEKDYKIESILESKREEIVITIHKDIEDKVGISTFNVDNDLTAQEFEKKLEEGIFTCSFAKKKAYEFPTKEDASTDDSHVNYDHFANKEVIEAFGTGGIKIFIAEKIESLKNIVEEESTKNKQVILNALEFFNTLTNLKLSTSSEISREVDKISSYLEMIFTCKNSEGRETEHIVYQKINDIYSFDYETLFKESVQTVKDTSDAKQAESFTGKVILSGSAMKDFFVPDLKLSPLIARSVGRLKYNKVLDIEIGDTVIEQKGEDNITIHSNPLLKNNIGSTPFDSEGVASKRVTLIEKGKLKSILASKQYADYLNIETSGTFGVTELEAGATPYEELLKDEDTVVEIVTFSSFVPDTLSGEFSAEIRLGYIIKNGVKKPFKGGLFSGNVLEILKHITLSKEVIEEAEYLGPKAIKFEKSEIIGI